MTTFSENLIRGLGPLAQGKLPKIKDDIRDLHVLLANAYLATCISSEGAVLASFSVVVYTVASLAFFFTMV